MAVETFSFPGSSNLVSGSYDDTTELLEITFRSGETYEGKVPQGLVAGLRSAGSAGSYYHRQIRSRYAMTPV